MTTYATIATAYHALSPVPATLTDAVATLNAQAATVNVDMPATAVRDVLLGTGEWGGLMLAIAAGSTAPANVQGLVLALKTLVDTNGTVRSSTATGQATLKTWIGDLNAAGLISSTTVTTLEALWSTIAPAWDRTLSVGDLQTALGVI